MLGEAFDYPRRGGDWPIRVGIGGILVLVGAFVLIPLIVVEGYVYRVLRGTTRGDHRPPEWEDWIDLFVEGIRMYIIQIAYVLVPTLLIVAGTLLAVVEFAGGSDLAGVGYALIAVGMLLELVVIYLLPAALSNFASTGQLGAAFDLGTVRRVALSPNYFAPVVISILLGIVLGTVGAVLSLVLVGVFVLFYLQVVIAYLWGRAYVAGGGVFDAR